MNYVVYTYRHPDENSPFYVGMGQPQRPYAHLAKSKRLYTKGHFYNKLNKLLEDGKLPIIEIVASDLTKWQANNLEIQLIKNYGRQDTKTGCLCNHTDGGSDGVGSNHRTGYETPIDTRIKLSRPRRGLSLLNLQNGARKKSVSIESFNLKTGEIIKKYEAVADVATDGYARAHVNAVANGRRPHHHGLGWRYSA